MKKQMTDSALWRNKIESMINRGTNVQEDTYVMVTHKEFIQLDHTKSTGKESCINSFVKSINRVVKASACDSSAFGYSIHMNNGDSIIILSDGTLKKYNKKNKLMSSKVGSTNDGHLRTTLTYPRQTTVLLERLMYIAHCVYNDSLPSSFDGVTCNVMDTSGNTENCFGAKYNLDPSNLEFCNGDKNTTAYYTTKKLYNMTGKLYRISAYDAVLEDAVRCRPVSDVLWYINKVGIEEVNTNK